MRTLSPNPVSWTHLVGSFSGASSPKLGPCLSRNLGFCSGTCSGTSGGGTEMGLRDTPVSQCPPLLAAGHRDDPASAWKRGCKAEREALAFPVGTSSAFPFPAPFCSESALLFAWTTTAC